MIGQVGLLSSVFTFWIAEGMLLNYWGLPSEQFGLFLFRKHYLSMQFSLQIATSDGYAIMSYKFIILS